MGSFPFRRARAGLSAHYDRQEGVFDMRLKVIACKALFRELSRLAAESPNAIDVTWLRQGYHNEPDKLRAWLQREIDAVESGDDPHTVSVGRVERDGGVSDDFDAIVLGYGLCSNAVTGVTARSHRLVIPRAHDCITLFLGSRQRYDQYFHELPGCFWYTASWIENSNMPGEATQKRQIAAYQEKGYDDETIEYLLAQPFIDNGKYIGITKAAAAFYGWSYHQVDGDLSLLRRLIDGDWSDDDFLILEPGETAVQSVDSAVIRKKA